MINPTTLFSIGVWSAFSIMIGYKIGSEKTKDASLKDTKAKEDEK